VIEPLDSGRINAPALLLEVHRTVRDATSSADLIDRVCATLQRSGAFATAEVLTDDAGSAAPAGVPVPRSTGLSAGQRLVCERATGTPDAGLSLTVTLDAVAQLLGMALDARAACRSR